ncbi:beige protein [Ceratobasidium sp. AG-Ba]|nr:beige protein [Ceratobasidium sp. AG-Ba]QRW11723.1 beige protein [Ceratobasidium sp. AG-Ba]
MPRIVGQTPRKLFTSPHPARIMEGVKTLPLGTIYGIEESYDLLAHTFRPIHTIDGPVAQLVIDNISDKIIPCGNNTLNNPDFPHERLEWGFNDRSLRLYADSRLQYSAESYDPTCATFVDGQSARLRCTRQMQAHTQEVLCVAASKAWSIVVSGSGENLTRAGRNPRGVGSIWDLKRGIQVWSTPHTSPVGLCAVMESTGNIATCSTTSLQLHTLNGHFIAEMDVSQPILALGFHEREYSPAGVLGIAIGGEISLKTWKPKPCVSEGSITDSSRCVAPGFGKPKWDFTHLRTLRLQTEGMSAATRMPRVTSLKFVGESLFHGDEAGRVYSWTLPE